MEQFINSECNKQNHLKEIKSRLEDNAREEVTKIDAIRKRSAKLEKAALEKRLEEVFKRVSDKNKYTNRLKNAHSIVKAEETRNMN